MSDCTSEKGGKGKRKKERKKRTIIKIRKRWAVAQLLLVLSAEVLFGLVWLVGSFVGQLFSSLLTHALLSSTVFGITIFGIGQEVKKKGERNGY